jgi:hypothetical protein
MIYRKSFSWHIVSFLLNFSLMVFGGDDSWDDGSQAQARIRGVLGFIKSMYLGDNPLLVN